MQRKEETCRQAKQIKYHCDSPVRAQQHWEYWYRMQGEVEGVEEEGERGRRVDRHSPQGELGGAGHLPLEEVRGRRGLQRQWV